MEMKSDRCVFGMYSPLLERLFCISASRPPPLCQSRQKDCWWQSAQLLEAFFANCLCSFTKKAPWLSITPDPLWQSRQSSGLAPLYSLWSVLAKERQATLRRKAVDISIIFNALLFNIDSPRKFNS